MRRLFRAASRRQASGRVAHPARPSARLAALALALALAAGAAGPKLSAEPLFAYDEGLDEASTYLSLAATASPLLFLAIGEPEDFLPAGLAAGVSVGLSWGAKELLKTLIPAPRPYVGGLDGLSLSEEKRAELLAEADESFPSGHTTMAFAGAAYLSALALRDAPGRRATPWLVAGSLGLATVTGVLRVVSGAHHPADALGGAILGGGLGLAGALLLEPALEGLF